jgi:hypothetical protein
VVCIHSYEHWALSILECLVKEFPFSKERIFNIEMDSHVGGGGGGFGQYDKLLHHKLLQ